LNNWPENLSLAWDCQCQLGESPVWSIEQDSLFFVDITGRKLLNFKPESCNRIFLLSQETGSIALARSLSGDLVAAQRNQFCQINLEPFSEKPIDLPYGQMPRTRFNDGKCDGVGRFWAATMDEDEEYPIGRLWSLGRNNLIRAHFGGFVVGNGIGWSLDNKKMYFTDSKSRQIVVFDYDLEAGSIGSKRCFATVDASAGYPDGLTVDSDDHVWSAHWDGGRVTRYRPDGTVERTLFLPVPRPTSISFGGTDFQSLYITSARIGLNLNDIRRAPWSGGLLEVKFQDVSGVPPMTYRVES
jgi:sugar lactone lactonase YvrE